MAQFKYLNEMTSLLTLDGPLTKGPVPRFQRKAMENANSSKAQDSSVTAPKTPNSKSGGDVLLKPKKTPGKTPSKSPSRLAAAKGLKQQAGDRFIPSRSATNFDLAHFKLHQEEEAPSSPSREELQRALSENLHGCDISKQRILSYQKKAPTAPEGFQNPNKVLYTQARTPASVKHSTRYIPSGPDRILDAPSIIDDYYLNLVDWSANNILAASLGSSVYLWDAGSGKVEELLELPGNDYICSVAWIQEGDHLAIGMTNGTTEIWDASQNKRIRIMNGHSARVSSLAWNNYVVSSGCRAGQIIHHDVRQREHIVSTCNAHTQEVCGLKWSVDGKYLASGGNDNVLNVWDRAGNGHHSETTPLYSFTAHQAAVKALAWCPWQPHILASGGGTADRHIRFWNCNTGGSLAAVDTQSQVCALLWSTHYKELISGHGFSKNQLIIWKYPSMTRVTELTGHTARILHLCMSPDKSAVLSAGADETLRIWHCFIKQKSSKSKENNPTKDPVSALKKCIR